MTPLFRANQYLLEGRWSDALDAYIEAWQESPFMRMHIRENVRLMLKLAQTPELTSETHQKALLVLTWSPNVDSNDNNPDAARITEISHTRERRAVGIASLPQREKGLRQAMDSLAHQIDEFHIYLNGYPEVPAWLGERPGVFVHRSQDHGDLGDSGKFFGYERTTAPWYFTCDDDIIYPNDYAEILLDAAKRHGTPVGVHGSILRYPVIGYYNRNARHVLHFKWKNNCDRRVHILGTGTMLIDRRTVTALPRFDFPNMADIWIAKFFAKRSIALHAVARGNKWLKDADVPAESIYSSNAEEQTDQRLIVDREAKAIGEYVKPVKGARKKVMVALKTFNRVDYLRQSIESLCATASDRAFEIIVAVADDGSTDGTLDYLRDLAIPFEFHIIKNKRAYVAGQFNSIVRLGMQLSVDFYFIADDDIYFKKSGWMEGYIEAAEQSGFDHLCHFNLPHFEQICKRNSEPFPPQKRVHRIHALEAHVGVGRAMGALFTLTPKVIENVGFADEVNYFVRGGWHGDYSARCCRAGFNELERFWDWRDSNEYIELQNTREENYRSSISWDSDEFKRASRPEERKRREAVRRMHRRVHIDATTATQGLPISIHQAESGRPYTVNEAFDRVFVINLDRRPDRMSAMDGRLRAWGIEYERFPAVDGNDAAVKEMYRLYRESRPLPDPKSRMSAKDFYFGGKTDAQRTAHIEAGLNGPAIRSSGALAYSLTYRKILRYCVESEVERVLILDDDCLFHKNFLELFSTAYKQLPSNWRIFQLGTMQYDWSLTDPYSEHLYLPRGVLVASHAVGLHAETYPSLLEGIDRKTLPFDIGPLQDAARKFSEESFVCIPNLIIQDQSESDINSSDVAKSEAAKKLNIYKWELSQYR